MSGSIFKRRRKSSSMSTGRPFQDDEALPAESAVVDGTPTAAPSRATRSTRSSSIAGLSSSFGLPTRSYIHHAGHGTSGTVQYSSSLGVRQETAELSSSFMSDSDVSRYFSAPDSRHSSDTTRLQSQKHETIEERSEPVTPEGRSPPAPGSSEISAALRHESSNGFLDQYDIDSEPGASDPEARFNNPKVIVTAEDEDDDEIEQATERSALLPRARLPSYRKQTFETASDVEAQPAGKPGTWNRLGHHYPSLHVLARTLQRVGQPKTWDFRAIGQEVVVRPASMLPAVFLGVLLNLLDALSYGIILFPLGEPVFADLGPDGVSMFYVSCIISQLTYSTGSIFRGGVGSEMIEVVPFFHKMTYMIMNRMGTERPDALIATVITSYAMSSIITGIVFFALGSARLGTLVNFFPHSILTGCIGGVGIFLFLTGIEVSARLSGNLELTKAVFDQLFTPSTLALWLPPLALAILLLVVRRYRDPPWLVPAYYIGITVIFYIITTAVPSINMEDLRKGGWVFEAPGNKPFYNFYSYYKFSIVDWGAVWRTVPSQLALTFFGILHVPINVPNLAMVVQEDNVSINRELIMHGISNTLSGCVGSIQNYLVFVNSVLFMNTGGNSRLAGYLLAAATFGLWVAGPVVIGYVPVMVVGTLIYMLGIELAQEALISTYGRLYRLEYATIVIIAFVMGVYDFVVGIAVGIGLACLVYVVQTSRRPVISAEFTGAVAESTVRRHPQQKHYLHKAGEQILVLKLQGYLFFGSIVRVEKRVRAVIDAQSFAESPIRYLILDFSHVSGVDFSAAEAFGRMNRIIHRREVALILANVTLDNEVGNALQMVGLFVEKDETPAPKVFEDLNAALESCENDLLKVLQEKQRFGIHKPERSPPMSIQQDSEDTTHASPLDNMYGSPRRTFLHEAAENAITETREPEQPKWQGFKQPLPLLLQAFQDLTDKSEDFWFRSVRFFVRRDFTKGQMIYNRGDQPDGFYLLQSGILRAEYFLDQGNYHESIVGGTTCGELPFFSETKRTSRVIAEQECIAWLLTPQKWDELQEKEPDVAKELLKVGLKLSAERMNAIVNHVLITAS
ncbi:hypothetical protein LTR97_009721 [Elasticomyces elasticus]|uniref:STAS domain-containing protein n=1 Tax=Elasticomyces elasticus TaxID=574655 RepID=A0AAN7VZJ4_9PEZI|nr:hypothetical protein LTR97_009721 [Elasticomyces elasticus]